MIKVKYTSPAIPQYPYDVELGVEYDCIKQEDRYVIKGINFEREFALDFIKQMFSPCVKYNWEMIKDENNETNKDSIGIIIDLNKKNKQNKNGGKR